MKSYKVGLLFIFGLLLIQSCAVSKYSNKKSHENVAMKIDENAEAINYALFEQQNIPTLASRGDKSRGFVLLNKAMPYITKGVIKFINTEKKKYVASYNQKMVDLYFYDQLSTESAFDPIGMQFTGFKLIRTIQDRSGNTDTAIYASFILDTSNPYEIINNSFFRLKVQDLRINYAKAKVASKKWYIPSFFLKNPDKLNMDIEITIRSSWVTPDAVYNNNVEIGKFYLTLRDVPMNKNSPEYKNYFEQIKGSALIGKCSLVPRSYGYYYYALNVLKKCYGQGIYSITADVKESGSMNFVLKTIGEQSTITVPRK